jgi:hypothetical protein
MCADSRATTLITMAETRLLELVKQAEKFRQSELAVSGESSGWRRRIDIRGALAMLGSRGRSTRRAAGLSRPIELAPATRSKW